MFDGGTKFHFPPNQDSVFKIFKTWLQEFLKKSYHNNVSSFLNKRGDRISNSLINAETAFLTSNDSIAGNGDGMCFKVINACKTDNNNSGLAVTAIQILNTEFWLGGKWNFVPPSNMKGKFLGTKFHFFEPIKIQQNLRDKIPIFK